MSGQKAAQEGERHYLHRGIAARTFRQTFNLAEHVTVVGASLENGLLTVALKREVPEALKPRRIAIGGTTAASGQDNARLRSPATPRQPDRRPGRASGHPVPTRMTSLTGPRTAAGLFPRLHRMRWRMDHERERLIPWSRSTAPAPTALSQEPASPFLTLQREMNRLFDDVFSGFGGVPSLASRGIAGRRSSWWRRTGRCASPPSCPASTRRTSKSSSRTVS